MNNNIVPLSSTTIENKHYATNKGGEPPDGGNMERRVTRLEGKVELLDYKIENLSKDMDRRFDQVDKRFDQVDKRFDQFAIQIKDSIKVWFFYILIPMLLTMGMSFYKLFH